MEYHNISTIQKTTNWHIDLNYIETITFNCQGQEVSFTPDQLINLLTRAKFLTDHLDDIMDLVAHRDQILKDTKSLKMFWGS
jgi:hypothetical protein